MNNNPAVIKANLDKAIEDLAASPEIFSKNPISPEAGNSLFLMSSGSPS